MSLNNIIAGVGLNLGWASPECIDNMFVDAKDHHGLIYWFDRIEKEQAALDALNTKK